MDKPCFDYDYDPEDCDEIEMSKCQHKIDGNGWETCSSGKECGYYAIWLEEAKLEICPTCGGRGKIGKEGK